MNKKKLISLSIAAVFTITATSTLQALPNSKPFQELNALIDANATAIDENGDLIDQNPMAILSLSSQLTALDGRVATLETDVAGLTTRFTTLEGIIFINFEILSLLDFQYY